MSHSNFKYKLIDENMFKQIDTEEKAYIIGLLWSDGHNHHTNQSGTISISLNEDDVDILEKVKKVFYGNVDRPLYKVNKKKVNVKWKNQYSLCVCSKIISYDLLNLGMVSNKTFSIKMPDNIPSELVNHFLRGVFDGDGHFTIPRRNSFDCTFGITGNMFLLKQIQDLFFNKLGLKYTKINITDNPKIGRLRYTGIKSVNKIYNFLYQNSSLYMERKFKKFNDFFVDKLERIKKQKTSIYKNVCFDKNRNRWIAKNQTGFQKRFLSENDVYLFTLTS